MEIVRIILHILLVDGAFVSHIEACPIGVCSYSYIRDSISEQRRLQCHTEQPVQPSKPNALKVTIRCDVPATVDTVIFSAWTCSEMREVHHVAAAKIDVIEADWTLYYASTCLQESLKLTKVTKESEPLNFSFKVTDLNATDSTLRFALMDESYKPLYYSMLHDRKLHISKRAAPSNHAKVSGYLIVANHLYLHHISLDGRRSKVAVSGLGNAVGVDFHFRNNSLYWTDSSQRAIMKSTLEGLKKNFVIDHGLTQPGSLSVDWISNKLYWTDVQERQIGVLDLVSHHHKLSLISTDRNINPRGLAVDPTTGSLYWTEWSYEIARVRKALMDGSGTTILFQNDLQRPYAISVDFADQILYWADASLNRIECANVDGNNRRVVISSGLDEPFDLTLLGDMIYISDANLGILATNKSGAQPVEAIYNRFCDHVGTVGIQAVAEERQLLASNPCERNNGGCSYLCLLSSTDSRGFSCACPEEISLHDDNTTCSQNVTNMTSDSTERGSCRLGGFRSCSNNMRHSHPTCFCDSDCYHYGDCCEDIEDTCSPQNESSAYLLISNILYIHQVSVDGSRIKTLYSTDTTENIVAIDYDYRANTMFWSTSDDDGIWQSQLDGSQATSFHVDGVHTIDDVAVDWISKKVYWTNNGPVDRIGVLDIKSGYYASLINTGQDTSPRAIVVDPINRYLYWSDWGTVGKIEKASMDGKDRTVIHNTDLVWPNGLTLDHAQQILYWTDASRGKIESSRVDGSNRRTVSNRRIYQPFGISVYRDRLFFTDFISGVNTIPVVNGIGNVSTTLDNFCENVVGIEVVSIERQPIGTNLCGADNGGCSHLCLLSSINASGYSCACPDGLHLSEDAHTCYSNSTVLPVTPFIGHGTCVAAGYTGGCCTSGTCRGSPPTCSCDSVCHLFRDCCMDVPPSCQPAIDVLEFVVVPSNNTVILGAQNQQIRSQFHCSVRASRVTNFEWTFISKSHSSSSQSSLHQISNELGSLDVKYSVVSTDYASTLTIENVQFSDAGIYTCIASIGGTLNPIEASAYHSVEVLPSVPDISGSIAYSSEQTIHLSCQVEAFPQPSIFWIFKTQTKIWNMLNTSRVSVSSAYTTIEDGHPYSRSQLIITDVNSNNSGDYLCIATTKEHNKFQSTTHSLSVTMTNECEQSRPPCLNGATCINHDQGYSCICSSAYMGENCSQRIEMVYPLMKPTFISLPSNELNIDFGRPIILSCQVEGSPSPKYEWYKDGILIPGATQPSLHISEALPDDRGNYTCKATNSEGTVESDQTHVYISGILQYVAVLQCNATFNISEQALTVIVNPFYLHNNDTIFSIEHLATQSNMSDNVCLLVTVLTKQKSLHFETRKSLTLELARVCPLSSLIRFDGCEINNQTDLDLGKSVEIPCPCHEFLKVLPGVWDQKARRVCSGSYIDGAHLQDFDLSQCVTIISGVAYPLCMAAMNALEYPLEALEDARNNTANYQLSSMAEVTLLSRIIEILTDQAAGNPIVTDGFLSLIDYFQRLDRGVVDASQDLTNSSTRVLNSLERFVSIAGIDRTENNTMKKYAYQSYGIALVDANIEEFEGQTFTAKQREDDTTNIANWNMVINYGPENGEVNDSVATIHLPRQLLNDCIATMDIQRVTFFVFRTDILFPSINNYQEEIVSVVIAARLNCSNERSSSTPITVTFNFTDQRNSIQTCASWIEGSWSAASCQGSSEVSSNLIKCVCYEGSYFGVLINSPSAAIKLSVYTYIACIFSCFFLIFAMIGLKNFSNVDVTIFFILVMILVFKYILFMLGAHLTSIQGLCGINSGLQHYVILVFFCWTMVYSLRVYLILFKVCGLSRRSKTAFIKVTMVLSWILPLLIVAITAGVWSAHYISAYYCGVNEWPLYFGLIFPLTIICIVNFILNVCSLSKIIRNHQELSISAPTDSPRSQFGTAKARYSITIINITFIIFYTGLIFGLLSINSQIRKYSAFIQIAFALITSVQGPLLFVYALYSFNSVKTMWISGIFFCKSSRVRTIEDTADLPPTIESDTSSHSLQSATFQSKQKKSKIISTGTNPAYESVVWRLKKDSEQIEFTMTENEVYGRGRINKTRL